MQNEIIKGKNPLTMADFPDPDVIRVGDTYYICSTTMYYMPGGALLRSYDLINWEFCSHIYETLEDTPRENLDGENHAYANGMWAPCLRYHDGVFHVIFIANDTHKTYHFTAENPEGPWKKSYIEGFYHDCSVLFDDDGKVYIMYGNREIHVCELKPDLSGPVEGTDKVVIRDDPGPFLGYEGTHLYKINGKYYAFFIHAGKDEWIRIEAAFMADDIYGEWKGGDVIRHRLPDTTGVAQGGIVDTPDGDWYGVIFGDRGAVGRIPNLVPMHFDDTGFPVFDTPAIDIETKSTRPGYVYDKLFKSDDFNYAPGADGKVKLDDVWEFNHNPKNDCWSAGGGKFTLVTEKIAKSAEFARNTLTQRTKYPETSVYVNVDGSNLNDGDFAGLVMLQAIYGFIGIAKENGKTYLVMRAKAESRGENAEEREYARVELPSGKAAVKATAKFSLGNSCEEFWYLDGEEWRKLGIDVHPQFDLRHFVGVRVGLCAYSTIKTGGKAEFAHFVYED